MLGQSMQRCIEIFLKWHNTDSVMKITITLFQLVMYDFSLMYCFLIIITLYHFEADL